MDPLKDQNELANYLADSLLEQLPTDSLDESSLETLKQDLVERINRDISQIIFDNLADEQLEELESLLEEGDSVQTNDFLKSAIPDLRRLIIEKLINLKEDFNL
jgi:hypothetical protein